MQITLCDRITETTFRMHIGFLAIKWTDILDIGLVAFLLYRIYYLVRGSIASRVFLGYLLVYIFYLIIKGLGLELMTSILQSFMGVGAIALIVIFQQEIRRFLLILGKSTIFTNNRFLNKLWGDTSATNSSETLRQIVEASKAIASDFNGALIAIQKRDELGRFLETGIQLDASISKQLLISIFNQYSVLQDGAVIIGNNRILAAKCVLPVADGVEIPSNIGFRHRAALGLSETTDAAVIVISEQTGKISVAIEGDLLTGLSSIELLDRLSAYLSSDKQHVSKPTGKASI